MNPSDDKWDSVNWDSVQEFGTRLPDGAYRVRPGVYAVIVDAIGQVALVRIGDGYHLPGGGAEGEESPEETLHREVREETGLAIVIQRVIGRAIQIVHSRTEGGFEKRCTFIKAMIDESIAPVPPIEPDHSLEWFPREQATKQRLHDSHLWAIQHM